MLACSLWLAWSVPSSVKYRSAVNCASINRPWEKYPRYVRFWLPGEPLEVALDAGDDA
jgi:hypothetical protein